jgi:peroxiredoxin
MSQRFHRFWTPFAILFQIALIAAPVTAGDTVIGKAVEDFTLPDHRGKECRLSDWQDRKLVVLVFLNDDCPVAKAYMPRLVELSQEFEGKGVAFVATLVGTKGGPERLERFQREHHLSLPILEDADGHIAARIGAARTPEAFLLDERRIVRYRGRVDDQYQPGLRRPRPGRRDLAEAIAELLAGKPVSVPQTEPAGCIIDRPTKPATSAEITYGRDVAPIVQKRCVSCHRKGQAAPFSLTSHAQVASRLRRIREAIDDGRMPPWLANPEYGKFANDTSLSAAEKRTLFAWIDSGAPEGDPRDLPPPLSFPEGWRIPTPDVVIPMPDTFTVPARGLVDYQYFEVDPGFTEDKWVQMAEMRPSNRAVVHHGLVYLRPPGVDGLIAQGDLKSIWLTGVGPGSPPLVLPPGRAKRIPAGWRLVFQLHYVAVGSEQEDRTSLGLVFADPKTVKQEVATNMALVPEAELRIPPHAADHVVEADHTFADDVVLLSLNPHMHLRGRSFRFEAIFPGGAREILLDVPRYDFNWQDTYLLAEPRRLPRGTVMHCVAHFDNSSANPVNPDPSAEVHWGSQVEDEMMIGYFDIVKADQDLTSWQESVRRAFTALPWPLYAGAVVILLNILLIAYERRRRRRALPT